MARLAFGIAIVVLAGTGGEIAVSHAMKRVGEVTTLNARTILRAITRAARLPSLWIGIALMAAAFFALLAVLSWTEVSFAIPVTALSYVVGAFGARVFLGEQVNGLRWLGVALVCAGVALVCLG
ncbi:MAG TPA: EamA family transporter [Vicinamibacterales bacterium]|jgi:drug/metabolite transporter (DMT)-like permease